jgi:hypothetical protein
MKYLIAFRDDFFPVAKQLNSVILHVRMELGLWAGTVRVDSEVVYHFIG